MPSDDAAHKDRFIDSRLECAACQRRLPAERIVVTVRHRLDTYLVRHEAHQIVAGFPSGRHGVGPPALRDVPAGWHFEVRDLWISYLADGTTARYVAGSDPAWRQDENVCRDCRDARVPPWVSQRAA